MIQDRIEQVLIRQDAIAARVEQLGEQITEDYRGREPLLVPAMRGALVFFADLMRRIRLDLHCDLIWVSSYERGTVSSGQVRILLSPQEDWSGRDVLFVEDIVDTGRTAAFLLRVAAERGAATARLCTLLDKPSRRVVEITPDYIGFSVPNHFVVGYGLDYQGRGRNLEYIGVLAV